MIQNIQYRKDDKFEDRSSINCEPIPSDVILLETELLEPLPVPEPPQGSWGQWLSTLREMYQTSDRGGKLILATAFSSVGLIGALAMAAWSLPANPIGFAVAFGLAPLPILLVYVWWLIIVSKN
jgi:hypothetical protein